MVARLEKSEIIKDHILQNHFLEAKSFKCYIRIGICLCVVLIFLCCVHSLLFFI